MLFPTDSHTEGISGGFIPEDLDMDLMDGVFLISMEAILQLKEAFNLPIVTSNQAAFDKVMSLV